MVVEYSVGIMTVIGSNCAVKRKGKTIKLTDDREMNVTDLGDRPKIQDGDILVAGTGSAFTVSCNPDSWKAYEKGKPQRSKYITIFPSSEARVKVEIWKGKDTSDQSVVCSNITELELVKGLFIVSFEGCDDEIISPGAILIVKDKATISIDLQGANLYAFKGLGSFEVKNKNTGRTYLAKGKFQEEVIVTQDSIYCKPLTKMDPSPTGTFMTPIGGVGVFKDSKEMISKQTDMAQNFGSIADQASVAMEMMKRVSPEQLATMSQNMSAEQKKQLEEGMKNLKKMESSGKMDEMKKAMEIGRAHMEGMGKDNLLKFKAISEKGADMAKGYTNSVDESVRKTESPRQYGPLKSEFKVA